MKIKSPESVGGEVTYTLKKQKLLRLLKRIESGGGTAGGAGASSSSGSVRKEREEFTLVFSSGSQDKLYSFGVRPARGSVGDAAQDRALKLRRCAPRAAPTARCP